MKGSGFLVQFGQDGPNGDLGLLGRNLPHLDVMLLAQVVLNVIGQLVPSRLDALLHHDTAQGDDGDLGGAASDIDHHVALRGLHVQADTEGGRHRLENKVDIASSRVLRGITDRTDFHFRTAGRDAHHQFEVGGEEAAMTGVHLLDEAADHHFCSVEVCNNTIPQRTYGLDAGVGFLVHQFSLLAQGDALPCLVVDGHDGRFVQGYLVVPEDNGISRSQVYGQFLIEKSHIVFFCFVQLVVKITKNFLYSHKVFCDGKKKVSDSYSRWNGHPDGRLCA